MASQRAVSASRPRLKEPVGLVPLILIPLSNNLVALITWRWGLDLYPVLAAALYTYIGVRHLDTLDLGFRWSRRAVLLAILAGLALAVPSLLFFLHPVLVSSIRSGPHPPVTVAVVNGLLRRVLIDLPVLTAIIEELVFRHYLYFVAGTLRRTVLLNSFLFTVWHGVAAFTAVQGTSFGHQTGLLFLAYVGALASVFVGGVVFALVRYTTGSFAYSALTHWLTDSIIVIALWGVTYLGW